MAFGQTADVVFEKELSRIAFGSCSVESRPNDQLWKEVNNLAPDLWIWLGDNIYADTEDMKEMRLKYDIQKSHPDYQQLMKRTSILGIWDDHDYGANDAGKEYPLKDASKEELFRFLDIPADHPARRRQGAYQSYLFAGTKRIKIILLDTRYFRDSLKWNIPKPGTKQAIPNPSGQILGDAQWSWLERQLQEPNVDLFVLCSGIQVIPEEHAFEKWANFPRERERLIQLLAGMQQPLIILSGDRHISEVSRLSLPELTYPLYEFTSSSLTNPWSIQKKEPNRYREKQIIYEPNFSVIDIKEDESGMQLEVRFIGKDRVVFQTHRLRF